MSTSRGNVNRKRPQKHQNKTAFKNDLHDTSHKTKFLNSLEVTGVCKRCKDIIEWKIKYKKYKPLTAPRKCVECEQKVIKFAYHLLCRGCAQKKAVCTKCCKPVEHMTIILEEDEILMDRSIAGPSTDKDHITMETEELKAQIGALTAQPSTLMNNEKVEEESPQESNDIQHMLKELPERKRRTVLRYISKHQDGEQKITPEITSYVKDVLAGVENLDLFDDFDSDSDI